MTRKRDPKAKFSCPYCRSSDTVWRGYRYNEKTKKRMRLCNSCGRKFTPDSMFFRMRFHPDEIKRALELRKKGFSLAEARLRLQREGVRVSRWTISLWEKRYGKKFSQK